jgi:ABC-type amino acid transport substrate-binding protein
MERWMKKHRTLHVFDRKELSGIFHDVLVEAGRNLSLHIDFTEELSWGTMIEAIKSGRVDIVCAAIWPTARRAKFVDFTTPCMPQNTDKSQ